MQRLFLLDGMALAYRAHFALIRSPIYTSKGVNSSALYGFTNTILTILESEKPTHLAVAFDTRAPTPRHQIYPAYKANREEMLQFVKQVKLILKDSVQRFYPVSQNPKFYLKKIQKIKKKFTLLSGY